MRTLEFFSDCSTQGTLTAVAIVKEATRFVTAGFLRCARAYDDTRHLPRLCDYVTPCFSGITVVLQYLSLLLSGRGKRLALSFAATHSCLADWLSTSTGQRYGTLLRQALMTAASWTFARHGRIFRKFPWRLAVIVDYRLPLAYRQQVFSEVTDGCELCLDQYMTRRIRMDIIDEGPQVLLTEVWLAFLLAWCFTVRCHSSLFAFAETLKLFHSVFATPFL